MEILWSLGHRKTKHVEKNIYSNQLVQKVVESFSKGSSIDDWMVWRSGWPQWKNLIEIPELVTEVSLLEKLNSQPKSIEEPPSFDGIDVVVNLPIKQIIKKGPVSTTNSEGEWGEKREHRRFEARFRCIIRSSSLTFRTFTENISLGGVALEDSIPSELLGNECSIYITSAKNKKNLKFKIKVTPRPGAKFFSFDLSDQVFKEELSIWLAQYQYDTEEKKNAS